jgi:hypothetical protein
VGFIAVVFLGGAAIGSPLNVISIAAIAAIAGLILLLLTVSRNRYSAAFGSIFGWVPVTVGAATWPFWHWYADNFSEGDIGGDFFHAAADILPVLLLATVIDVRRSRELEGKQLLPPIAVVFFGELAALNALAFDTERFGMADSFAVVCSSLITATFALLIAVMANLSSPDEKPEDDEVLPAAKASVTSTTAPNTPAVPESSSS